MWVGGARLPWLGGMCDGASRVKGTCSDGAGDCCGPGVDNVLESVFGAVV